jgi:insulysin
MLKYFVFFMKLAAICETSFHYQDKTPPISYVVRIASNMQVSYGFERGKNCALPLEFLHLANLVVVFI